MKEGPVRIECEGAKPMFVIIVWIASELRPNKTAPIWEGNEPGEIRR